jgi:hypothetical protein
MVAAATIPPPLPVNPRSTAYAAVESSSATVPEKAGTACAHAFSVRRQASLGRTVAAPSPWSETSRTRSWSRPGVTSTTACSEPSSLRLASPAPVHRKWCGPDRPVQTPSSSDSADICSAPKSARTSSMMRIRSGWSSARMRRSSTAVCGSPGNASASRHSTIPSVVTHRDRQINDRCSYCPPQTNRGWSGETAYTPPPPSSELNTAALSQRGKHIQQQSPRGPTRTPRSPSASKAYSRSTCGESSSANSALSFIVSLYSHIPQSGIPALRYG